MNFRPRVPEAIALAKRCRPTAMIDLSDGLSRDLGHVCRESKVGAAVRATEIPVHTDVARLPRDARSPLEHALHDGEDYELLFTIPAAAVKDLPIPAHVIGAIQSEPGVWLEHPGGRRETLEAKGWEHGL
jgi:thiamine-monophosphate kinase